MSEPRRRCRCRVPDLLALREALEISQREMASTLGVTPRWLRELESATAHRCLGYRAVANLRMALADPYFQSLLKENEYPYPWPEDIGNGWFPGLQVGARCHVDGIPLKIHARCRACSSLAGPGHQVTELDNLGLCHECFGAISAGVRSLPR